MSRPPVPDTYYMPEYISEYETGIQVQTQLESDVTMARRRHGNHTDMQFVFIPQTKPNTLAHVSGPLMCQYRSTSMTSLIRSLPYSHAGVWSWGHTRGETDACLSVCRQHNERSGTLITPNRLTFGEEVDTNKGKDKEEGAAGVDDDLKKPYKEVLESPFSRRIIEFSSPSHRMPTNLRVYDGSTDPDDHISRFVGAANQGEWEMPVWCRMFQQTLNGPARGWFDRMPNGCIDSWSNLCEKFVERFALRRRCSKDPIEVSKIVRKTNESLPNFKERWTEEMGYIQGVPEVMQISAFMSNSKCPELARRFANQVPQTVTEMMKQLEIALESGKLNHLVKDVRQRAGNCGIQGGNSSTNGKIINMVYEVGKNRKRKCRGGQEEDWMSAPITFPSIPSDDVSDEPLIIEAEIEGYLVRRVFVDQGAAVQVMFEHYFRNLCPTIQARLTRTHTELVGFSGEQLMPIGKIELEVVFGNECLSRRTMMKFTVARKKQGSDERGSRMARSGDSEASAIPYMDIKSGAGKEVPTGRYVVSTGRVIATDSVIVATSGYIVPADFDISPSRVKKLLQDKFGSFKLWIGMRSSR
ncbi:reverse transcriptase domain-containing protein [Tanacetum coccineum]